MAHATIRLEISYEKTSEALEILCFIAERIRDRLGCISCRIYRDVQEEHVIMFEKPWTNQKGPDRHIRSTDFRNLLLVVEMAKSPPKIQFSAILHTSGVETIKKARGFKY